MKTKFCVPVRCTDGNFTLTREAEVPESISLATGDFVHLPFFHKLQVARRLVVVPNDSGEATVVVMMRDVAGEWKMSAEEVKKVAVKENGWSPLE